MTHLTCYDQIKKRLKHIKIFLTVGLLLTLGFIVVSGYFYNQDFIQIGLRSGFVILIYIALFIFLSSILKKIQHQYVNEKNNTIDSLSLKYKNSIEKIYDEHIFAITHELRSPLAVIGATANAHMEDIRSIYNKFYNNNDLDFEKITMFKEIKSNIVTIEEQVDIIEIFIRNLAEYGSYVSSRSNEDFKIFELKPYLTSMLKNAPTFSRNMKVFNGNIGYGDDLDFDCVHVPVNANELTRILINVFKNSSDAILNNQERLKERDSMNFVPSLKVRCVNTKDINKTMKLKSHIHGPFGCNRIASPFYLIIEDNGPGISEKHQKKIFKYGFSTKATKENLGLGLHISMQLAENNKLALFFDTSEKGTKFIIGFPHVLMIKKAITDDKDKSGTGWIASPKEISTSKDSQELFDEIVHEIIVNQL